MAKPGSGKRAIQKNAKIQAEKALLKEKLQKESKNRRKLQAIREKKNSKYLLNIFVILLAVRLLIRYLAIDIITCSTTQPLVVQLSDYLKDEDLKNFQSGIERIMQMEEVQQESALSTGNFADTNGIVLGFNKDGIEDLRNSKYNVNDVLYKFFQFANVEGANCFVMNLLIVNESEDITSEHNEGIDPSTIETSVGAHADDTLLIHSIYHYMAYQVSVFYVDIPEDMEGGELDLFYRNNTDVNLPDETITPKTNTLVGFRGDAYHQVRKLKSISGKSRISLVLENYLVDGESEYAKTERFKIVDPKTREQSISQQIRVVLLNLNGPYKSILEALLGFIFCMIVFEYVTLDELEKKEVERQKHE